MQKKKGISLIVLVITIIVMIILAAAVIISLNNSGIIDRAQNAVKDYNEQEVIHIAQVGWADAYIDGARTVEELTEGVESALRANGINPSDYDFEITTNGVSLSKGWIQDGATITKGSVTIEAGDLIQYNAGVAGYSGKWKVLGAEDGKLLIMSTENISTTSTLGSDLDIANLSTKLDQACAGYGNGTGAVGSRSIKADDINRLTGYNKSTYQVNELDQYGNKVTVSWDSQDEKIAYTTTNGLFGVLNKNHEYFKYLDINTKTLKNLQSNESASIENTFYGDYSLDFGNISQNAFIMLVGYTRCEDDEDIDCQMIFQESSYSYILNDVWQYTHEDYLEAGVYEVRAGELQGTSLLDSSGTEVGNGSMEYYDSYIRCVVELSPKIQIGTKDATNGWNYSI